MGSEPPGTGRRPRVEDLLRASLAERARDVRPDPNTWSRVQQRIRRRRTLRLAVGGFAAAAVVAFAAVALPGVLGASRVELQPGVASRPPAPDVAVPAPLDEPAGGAAAAEAAVVFSQAGDVVLVRADGSVQRLTEGPLVDAHPALSPDGATVAFDRRDRDGAPAQLVLLDLATGGQRALGPGEQPAFGPSGHLAWVRRPAAGARQAVLAVDRGADGSVDLEFPASDTGVPLSVSHLTFDGSGGTLAYQAYWEGPVVWVAEVSGERPQPANLLAPDVEEGGTFAAPSASRVGVFDVVHRCCVETEGDPNDRGEIGTLTVAGGGVSEVGYEPRAALPDGFDLDAPRPLLRAVGRLRAQGLGEGRFRLVPGEHEAWLAGDGDRLWLVDDAGEATVLANGVDGVGVHPVMLPAPEPSPTDEASPPPVVQAQVYLAREGRSDDCLTTFARSRSVPASSPLRGALEALLAGPTGAERAEGYGGWFSADTAGLLADVRLADGTAHIDFDPALRERVGSGATSSCGSQLLLSQLDNTARQFPTVRRTVYSLGGDVQAFYEWLQRAPEAPGPTTPPADDV